MSKQIIDLKEMSAKEVSDDDLFLVRDVSENRDKKVSVGDLIGRPLEGWLVIPNDTLTYKSYNNSSKVGTVMSSKINLYSVGMRIQFKQSNTVKYGVIVNVDPLSSILTIYFVSQTLANSAITEIQISQSYAPQVNGAVNFLANTVTGQIDGKPIVFAVKDNEAAPDVPPIPGCIVLEAILGDNT